MNVIKSNFKGLIGTNDMNADDITTNNIVNNLDVSSNTIHAHQIYIDNVLVTSTSIGTVGPQGPQGPQGNTGTPAQNNYFQIGTVNSLPYGSLPSITLSSYIDLSGIHYIQNYNIITGPTGLTGPQGPKGNTGDSGSAALTGALAGGCNRFYGWFIC